MKKYLFTAISLLAMLVTSCTNDDIEIINEGAKRDVKLNIETQSIYDTFDYADNVTNNYLRNKTRAIGVQTFVYNEKGELSQENLTTCPTFQTAFQNFRLSDGKYTIVTIETLVNPDVNNTSDDWSFEDTKSLSTLKIRQKGTLGMASVLGVMTQSVVVSKDMEINIVPEALGARVNFYCYNFKNSSHQNNSGVNEPITNLGLGTWDILNYYSPNPQLPRENRFTTTLSDDAHMNLRTAITADDSEDYYAYCYVVESKAEWMFFYQTEASDVYSWTYFPSTNISANIEDGKTYSAGFYNMGDKYVPQTFFGDKNGLDKWKKECDVLANTPNDTPKSLYGVPYTNWSVGTVSAVKSYMTDFTLVQDIDYDADNELYYMMYINASGNSIYEYDFTSRTYGLTDAWVLLDGSTFSLAQVREDIVKQGYKSDGQYDDVYFYSNSSTSVMVYTIEEGVIVNYFDPKAYPSAPKRNILDNRVKSRMQSMGKARKNNAMPMTNVVRSLTPFTVNKEFSKMLLK